MKKRLLLLTVPLLLLTGCSFFGDDDTDNKENIKFEQVEEFIPSSFDNNYDKSQEVVYDNAFDQNFNATMRVRGAYKVNGKISYTLASGFVYSHDDSGYYAITSASQISYKSINNNNINLYYDGAFEFTTADNRKYKGDFKGDYPEYDVAVFEIKTNDFLPTAILGNSDELKVGQDVSIIGTPNVSVNLINTYAKGVVSGLNRRGYSSYTNHTLYSFPTFQFDAPTNTGMEGGVVLNDANKVVGITSTKQHGELGYESLSFGVAINDIKNIIDSIITKGSFDKFTLGFTGSAIDFVNKVPWASEIGIYSGIYIVGINENTYASEAGLQENTIIVGLSINDGSKININSMEEFQSQLIRLNKNDSITLYTVNELGVETTHKITL